MVRQAGRLEYASGWRARGCSREDSPVSARSASSSDSVPESRSSTCNRKHTVTAESGVRNRPLPRHQSGGRGSALAARRQAWACGEGPRHPASGAASAEPAIVPLLCSRGGHFLVACDLRLAKPARGDTHLLGNVVLIQRMRPQLVSQKFEHY